MILGLDKSKPYICALYTRISAQEKNEVSDHDTIETQREMCENYVHLHRQDGWTFLKDEYVDRNCSGGTLNRPALRRLRTDARAGKFNMIIVKAIDRLTRNLKHFYELWEELQEQGIEIASATQEFNTATPTGRLHLDIVLRFAQYERELASERTSHKMKYLASKGKFCGGYPPLGYDLGPEKGILAINRKGEVKIVKLIFDEYLKKQSANLVARYLNSKGYRTKSWVTKNGVKRGGSTFKKSGILSILKDITYIGKTSDGEKEYPAVWKGIIDKKIFNRVQQILKSNTQTRASISQNKYNLLLPGLVWCSCCKSQMAPNYSKTRGGVYLYYKCTKVSHGDKTACKIKSVPARELEKLIIDRIKTLASNKELVQKVIDKALKLSKNRLPILNKEQKKVLSELRKNKTQSKPLLEAIGKKRFSLIAEELEPLEEQKTALEKRLQEITEEMERERLKKIDPNSINYYFKHFKDLFDSLPFDKQRDLLHLLIKKITYHEDPSKIKIEFWNMPEIKKPPKKSKKNSSGGSKPHFDMRSNWLLG